MGRNLERKRDSFLDKTTVLYLKVSFAEILKPSPCLPVWRLARTQKPSFESSTAWDRGTLLQSWCSIWAGLKAAGDPRRKEGTQVVGSVHCSWKEADNQLPWPADYQPALTFAAALPPVTTWKERVGSIFTKRLGPPGPQWRVYASNINMLENMSQNMSAGQESINFKREFANPTLIWWKLQEHLKQEESGLPGPKLCWHFWGMLPKLIGKIKYMWLELANLCQDARVEAKDHGLAVGWPALILASSPGAGLWFALSGSPGICLSWQKAPLGTQ